MRSIEIPDVNAPDSQRWAILYAFMNELKEDQAEMERKLEAKLDLLMNARVKSEFERGATSGRVESLEGQLTNERKDRLDLAKKLDRLQFWLLTLTAGLVVQLIATILVARR